MNYDGTADTSINSYNNYQYNCQYRLPCGYCERTGQMCYTNGTATYVLTNRTEGK